LKTTQDYQFAQWKSCGWLEGGCHDVSKTIVFDTHISPLQEEGYTAQATVSKPVLESLFHYLSVSLSFETVVSMEGDGYVFNAILARRYPLEAHP
jgi:hypothetical protein